VTCQELVDFLMAYLDRELPAAERTAFDGHLAVCPPCLVYLDTYRDTVALGRSVCTGDDPVPDDVPEDMVRAILDARRA
jgi:anti-sigma factor RsiW